MKDRLGTNDFAREDGPSLGAGKLYQGNGNGIAAGVTVRTGLGSNSTVNVSRLDFLRAVSLTLVSGDSEGQDTRGCQMPRSGVG